MREKVIYYHRMYKRVRVIVKRKSTEKREKAKETCIAAKYFTTGTEEYNKQKKRKTTTTNTKMYAKTCQFDVLCVYFVYFWQVFV